MEEQLFSYWKYYSNQFDWNETPRFKLVDRKHTLNVFKAAGFNSSDAKRLWSSGYVCIEGYDDIVIDRFYGGAIRSYDMVSRFAPSQIGGLFEEPKSRVWIKKVSSLEHLREMVAEVQSTHSNPIRFRGQRQNYFIEREINNPNFTIKGVGEVSILSSFWRKAFAKAPNSFLDFETLPLFEWSKVFYSAYDLKEIERRHQLAIANGEWMYSMQDMADSDDPILSEFGNHRLDLAMGIDFNLADTLSTLLQHYGLLSTVIDLTSSLDVALFFATHQYTQNNGQSTYNYIGSNNGKAVIYLIKDSRQEMLTHENDRALNKLPPERPKRQHCVISRSSPLAINLPAFFLEGIIQLDFEIDSYESQKQIMAFFPSEDEDKFLAALKKGLLYPDMVTNFA